MTVSSKGGRQPFTADPNHIWGDIGIIRKDHSWCRIRHSRVRLQAPGIQKPGEPSAKMLVLPIGLFGHVQFSIDNFIPLAIIGKGL